MKRIPLEQLLEESRSEIYSEQYQYVCRRIEAGSIIPVKSSPLNGKKPALHVSYWLAEEAPDYEEELEELRFRTVPAIRTDYYLRHPDVYRKERGWVRLLNRFFLEEKEAACLGEPPVSLNERSFQIWGREKFLQKEQGRKILTHCGVDLGQLGVYETTEPLAYYSRIRTAPQKILILENKDTFYSMRRWLLSGQEERKIFGVKIGTVIYGAGKGILRSFEDFRFCVEDYINDPMNEILYFGDLDYEGIGIYERLADLFSSKEGAENEPAGADAGYGRRIKPFSEAYEKMVEKAEKRGLDFLPASSPMQNRNLSGAFFRCFSREMKGRMERILETGKYVPQEIITITDYYVPEPGTLECT